MRRKDDQRPYQHTPGLALTLTPDGDEPFRWLPRHGQPSCIGEWVTQHAIKAAAWAPLYTAVVVTLTLLVFVFGVPFVED